MNVSRSQQWERKIIHETGVVTTIQADRQDVSFYIVAFVLEPHVWFRLFEYKYK